VQRLVDEHLLLASDQAGGCPDKAQQAGQENEEAAMAGLSHAEEPPARASLVGRGSRAARSMVLKAAISVTVAREAERIRR
jgi:hypothetical protein